MYTFVGQEFCDREWNEGGIRVRIVFDVEEEVSVLESDVFLDEWERNESMN